LTVREEIDRLLARDHPDPHHVLGAHPGRGGVCFRCYRPGAEWVRVLPEGHEPFRLRRTHREGVFAGTLEAVETVPAYELEVGYPDWEVVLEHDAYAFPPTVGELDLHLIAEGRHERLHDVLGAHPCEVGGVPGVAFAVWAPSARAVAVAGDFNGWEPRRHPMRSLGAAGIWELFVPGLHEGGVYKFEIRPQEGEPRLKADPLAASAEEPPRTGSVVYRSRHEWRDGEWLARRAASRPWAEPMSVYEVHLPSWRWNPREGNRPLRYEELGEELGDYAVDLGFTHVELMPVMEHPFGGSWGYQVTGFFAPTARLGAPDDFRTLVDRLHARGLGVILDWVPAHFPRDDFALARFDGTALYEHADPRRGAHPDWGTLIFNYGRTEVRNFLLASALSWLEDYHADGLRVDAVASMLYLDYSRGEGEWLPNERGGRENLDAVSFLRELNEVVHRRVPGVAMTAEESTAWPGVSRPTDAGGLGFGFKWNLGWMHDTLRYFARDPVHRSHHQDDLTFSLVYAFSENFVLPLSHDEVVHGKGSLLARMPGDRRQQLANLRALYGYTWAHPGKQLLFMGGELAQEREWSHDTSLDWHLRDDPAHAGVQALVRDLNRAYRAEPALWEADVEPEGFEWLDASDAAANVIAFVRRTRDGARVLVCACNFSAVPREGYRLGLPRAGRWRTLLCTDDARYGGASAPPGPVDAVDTPWHGRPWSAALTLPPLAVLWLVPEGAG
jgi:1,4-alpha-glucan branching enzyme